MSGYENEAFEPDSETLLKLAKIFDVSTDYLLGLKPTQANKKPTAAIDDELEEYVIKFKAL